MARSMKKLLFAFIVIGFFSKVVPAATYTATSCNEFTNAAGTSGTFASPDPGSVMGTYATEQASAADGDIIAISACPSGVTWSSQWTLSPTNSLTFQGAGALIPSQSCTFVPGTACSTTSGSDETEIIDGTTAPNRLIIVTIAANKTFRITGLEYNFPSSNTNTGTDGQWDFVCNGGNCNLRIDHNHFYGYAGHWMEGSGWGPFGVADHNLVDLFLADTNWFYVDNGVGWNGDNTAYGQGNGSWADGSKWGSSQAFFIENNVFPNDYSAAAVAVNDCGGGGRQVFRYNTFNSPANLIQAHEGGGNNRGCRTTEVYGNTSTVGASSDMSGLAGTRSGSIFAWGNVGAWKNIITPAVDRLNNANGNFQDVGNLGQCGPGASGTLNTSTNTATFVSGYAGSSGEQFSTTWPTLSTPNIIIGSTSYAISSCSSATSCTLGSSAGQTGASYYAPSVWDGSGATDATATGYPCYDQPGRGQGDLIVGSIAAGTRKDNVTGTARWPNEAVDPMYVWDNTVTWPSDSSDAVVGIGQYQGAVVIHDNRDYYQQMAVYCYGPAHNSCGENPSGTTLSPGQTITFTGAAGIGQGPYSSIPSTCTAGLGGNTPGVGYWATDRNTFYVCNPANTWTSYYTPYTYPHPLTASVSPPTSLGARAQ